MPNWDGAARDLPPDWHRTQPRILARDGYQCQHIREDTGRPCALPARDVDHIVPRSEGGSEGDENLRALCKYHHGKKSGGEGGRASGVVRRRKAAARKPSHPGLSTNPGPPEPRRTPTLDEGPAPF